MPDLIVLVHAPVLGPASWQPTGAELSRAGLYVPRSPAACPRGAPPARYRVAIPELTGFAAGEPPYAPRLIARFADQVAAAQAAAAQDTATQDTPARDGSGGTDVVLVVHSGAGPFATQLAAAVPGGQALVIFADAGLPGQSGATPVVDAGFLPYLRQIARDGVVPPWPQWFPDAEPTDLFPTEAARAAVLADARPLPLSFFEEELAAVPGGPPFTAAGYLLFSAGYQQEAAQARERGWPVTEVPGSHLHPLVSPASVAAAIADLVGQMKPGPPYR
jgi:hypothetical protein